MQVTCVCQRGHNCWGLKLTRRGVVTGNRSMLGSSHCTYKGPVVRACLACPWHRKGSQGSKEQGARGRVKKRQRLNSAGPWGSSYGFWILCQEKQKPVESFWTIWHDWTSIWSRFLWLLCGEQMRKRRDWKLREHEVAFGFQVGDGGNLPQGRIWTRVEAQQMYPRESG